MTNKNLQDLNDQLRDNVFLLQEQQRLLQEIERKQNDLADREDIQYKRY